MRRSGSQKGARPVPQARWVSVPARLLLQLGMRPGSISHTKHWVSKRASSTVLHGQWKPDFSEFPYLVSLRLHGIWCLRPTPTPCKQQWILRRNGPETHMALSFPLSRAVSNWMSLVGLALDASPASLPG